MTKDEISFEQILIYYDTSFSFVQQFRPTWPIVLPLTYEIGNYYKVTEYHRVSTWYLNVIDNVSNQ